MNDGPLPGTAIQRPRKIGSKESNNLSFHFWTGNTFHPPQSYLDWTAFWPAGLQLIYYQRSTDPVLSSFLLSGKYDLQPSLAI